MFRFSIFRLAVLAAYFLLCMACGQPRAKVKVPGIENQGNPDTGSVSTSSDINFIGGGSQAPEPANNPAPYDSPFISLKPDPTSLMWVSDISEAIRLAKRGKYKIIVWFRKQGCAECIAIERNIFTDPEVFKVSRPWLFVKIDTEVNKDRAEYYLQGADPPALVFLDREGHEYKRYFGAFTRDELISMMTHWQ